MSQRQSTAPNGRHRRGSDVDRLRRDSDRLRALVAELPADAERRRRRDLQALDGTSGLAELHLRSVGALMVSVDTWLRGHRRASEPVGPAVAPDAGEGAAAVDPALAAASARYIARDLAARRLSEFTSAEGYRLARALATIGGALDDVERLLADANTVRLHPMPLTEAVSHSAR